MKIKLLPIIFVLLLFLIPVVVEGIDIAGQIESNPLLSSLNIALVGDLSDVVINEPVMVVGSEIDILEKRMIDQLVPQLGVENLSKIEDDVREYQGREIWDYDLIVIGGPAHNKVAKELLDLDYLTLTSRQSNKPSFVIENAVGPKGKTVLLLGDVYGYEFDEKNLPIERFLPESQAAVAAVVTSSVIGIGLSATSSTTGGTGASLLNKLTSLFRSTAEEVAEEKVSDKDKRDTEIIKKPGGLFGLTFKEIIFGITAAVIFGVAYAWAELQLEFMTLIGIYIIAAGIAFISHEFAQNIMAYKYGVDAEFKLWNMGIILVGITSYVFGNVFAVPARSVTHSGNLDKKQEGLIALSGAAINLVLAALFFLLISSGGVIGQIAVIAIPINLLLAVYDLMPFAPMDGKSVKDWSFLIWIIFFLPSFAIYFWYYLL